MDEREFKDLLDRCLEGVATPQEEERLIEAAKASEGLGRVLLETACFEAALKSLAHDSQAFADRVTASLGHKDASRRFARVMRNRLEKEAVRRRHPGGPAGLPGWVWGFVAVVLALILGAITYALKPSSERRGPEPSRIEEARRDPGRRNEAPPPAPKTEVKIEAGHAPLPAPPEEKRPQPPPAEPRVPESPVPKAVEPKVPAPAPAPSPRPLETPPTVAAIATLERAEGEVFVINGTNDQTAARAGLGLFNGQGLKTSGTGSGAAVKFPDGTLLELGPDTALRELAERQGKRIAVAQGSLHATLGKQPADQPAVFATAHADVRILGTRLALWVETESTRLDVKEGRVRLTRSSDKSSIEVTAGHYAVAAAGAPLSAKPARTAPGLLALYLFNEGRGAAVRDGSRIGPPLDLSIENEAAVKWVPGGLAITSPTIVASSRPATKIIETCRRTNEIAVEAWVRPAAARPAQKDGRIATVSADPFNQDFMLGQDELNGPAGSFFMRFRTTTTDKVGKPALASPAGSSGERLLHVVYTRTASGAAVLYLDGVERARATVGGNASNWNEASRLALANEFTNDRAWLGEYQFLAIYGRALSAEEVKQHYRAGPD